MHGQIRRNPAPALAGNGDSITFGDVSKELSILDSEKQAVPLPKFVKAKPKREFIVYDRSRKPTVINPTGKARYAIEKLLAAGDAGVTQIGETRVKWSRIRAVLFHKFGITLKHYMVRHPAKPRELIKRYVLVTRVEVVGGDDA